MIKRGWIMLCDIFNPARIKLDLEGTTKTDVFRELAGTIAGSDPEYKYEDILEAVTLRETKMNTVVMPGIAVPHGYYSAINGIVGAIGFSHTGIEYPNPDQEPLTKQVIFSDVLLSDEAPDEVMLRYPVHLFFMLIMDESSREKHLHVLSRLLTMISSTAFTRIRDTGTPQELYNLLCNY